MPTYKHINQEGNKILGRRRFRQTGPLRLAGGPTHHTKYPGTTSAFLATIVSNMRHRKVVPWHTLPKKAADPT